MSYKFLVGKEFFDITLKTESANLICSDQLFGLAYDAAPARDGGSADGEQLRIAAFYDGSQAFIVFKP